MPAVDVGRKGMGIKMILTLWILLFLAVNSLKDIRKREISLRLTAGFAIAGIVRAVCLKIMSAEYFAALGIGGFVMMLSGMSGGAIGIGDGLVLLALGTVMTWQELGYILMRGIFCCSICSVIILLLPRRNRKTQIPFVPFILMGYIGGLIFER